jgi:N-acetylneuraminic acid mutarotase
MIFVFGGEKNASEIVGTVYRYDTGTDEWSTCAPMPEPRCYSGACTMDSMMYVVGGIDDNNPVDSVFRYDPGSDTWSELAPMPAKMIGLGLYVREGCIHASCHSHSFVYDPSSDSWSAGQALSTPRYDFQACTVKVEVDVFDAMIGRARQRTG